MVCVRLPAVKFKRRVQVTVWAGTFVRFAAFEVAGRLLGVLGHEGAVAALAIEHFSKVQRLASLFDAVNCCFDAINCWFEAVYCCFVAIKVPE